MAKNANSVRAAQNREEQLPNGAADVKAKLLQRLAKTAWKTCGAGPTVLTRAPRARLACWVVKLSYRLSLLRLLRTRVSVSTPSRAVQNELRMLTVEEFSSAWLSDDRLCWGLGECSKPMASPKILRRRLYRLLTNLPVVFPGPFLALNIGFWSTATLFEIAILLSWCSLIEYSTERPRRECLRVNLPPSNT